MNKKWYQYEYIDGDGGFFAGILFAWILAALVLLLTL